MRKIAIYGAGGFGREVAGLIGLINKSEPTWEIIGFFDDGRKIGETNEFGKVIGGINELNLIDFDLDICIAIGSPAVVEKIVGEISNPKISFPNVIAPDLTLVDNSSFRIGKGNIITSGCIITCNVKLGDFNIINLACTIGHDATLGNFNSLMPMVNISGEVVIGNNNYFGVSSTVLQGKKIGYNTVVGASSLILRDTEDNTTYVGSPGKPMVKSDR